MATLLVHPYAPGHRHGILLNPSPATSPAYQPASLPALVPSNSSLSSSASSTPPDASDYFSQNSPSPSPVPPKPSPPPQHHTSALSPTSKPRNGSNQSTVRRIRFAPLPEPRRDDEDESLPPVFFDDESDPHPSTHPEPQLTMFSALAAASISLAVPVDSDLFKRVGATPTSPPSSPCATRKPLPTDSLLLDHSCPPSSSESSDLPPDSHHASVPSDCGTDCDVVSPTPATPHLTHHQSVPLLQQSPRKPNGLLKVFSRFARNRSSQSTLARTFSASESASINGDAHRGRSSGLFLGVGGSRNSSVSRDGSLPRRDSDFGTPLHRWTSEGGPAVGLPISKKKRHLLFGGSSSGNGVPLGRSTSLTSLPAKDDKKAAAAKTIPAPGSARGRKQQRLLNGRVYGAKRNPPANPFANARPAEPEFVEWGYGGMGSVKNAGQSSMWARVQAGDDASGLNAADDDDGSGMGWVKRRREQREREARERAEREKAEAEREKAEPEPKSPEVSEVETQSGADSEATKVEDGGEESEEKVAVQLEGEEEKGYSQKSESATETAPANAKTTSPSTPSTPLASDMVKLQQFEHITQAITIPAPSPHPRHHHSHSIGYSHAMYPAHHHSHAHRQSLTTPPFVDRRESDETARGVSVTLSNTADSLAVDVSSTSAPPSSRLRTDSLADTEEGESVSSSGASALSSASDDADDGDVEESPKDSEGGFGQDEDEDEEDEQLVRSRMAVGAGVEKIARHHKEDHSTTGTPETEVPS